MRSYDWSRSPLGSAEAWPQSLKTAISIMLNSRYAMWMLWGPEFTFFCNDAYRPTLGVKAGWALGSPSSTVWAEIWKDIGPRIDQVLTTGVATWDEALMLFLERSGFPEETYHTFSYSPLRDDDGAVAGMLCVVTEETERMIGERRLLTLRSLAESLTGAKTEADVAAAVGASLAPFGRDLPFTLTYLFDQNRTRASLFTASGIDAGHPFAPGTLAAATAPWPLFELSDGQAITVPAPQGANLPLGEWDRPCHTVILQPIAQQGQGQPAGCLVAAANPYRALDANYMSFVGLIAGQVAASLADARAFEEERKRAEALAEIDRAKTAFFSNVNHEFRTPLTLMLGPLEELTQRASLDPGVRDDLALIHRNGRRLLKLVNALLDFSRIEAGRIEARYQPTELAALTADLASVFRSATEKAGLFLKVEASPLPEPVWVDREMWEKIVLNLISNAFKFTHTGGVSVTLAGQGDRAVLTVRDTGIGIPASEMPRLFERFHRVPGAQGRSYEGSGIGLAMVAELVKLHGGQVTAESVPGDGTAFHVSIPFGHAHLPPEKLDFSAQVSAETTAAAVNFAQEALGWTGTASAPAFAEEVPLAPVGLPASPPKTRPRIVLADDNADMRGYLERLLTPFYEVTAVADGEAALAATQAVKPDLVLSDVMMPKMDGFGLLRALRDDRATKATPVILLSARAGEEARMEGLAAGVDDYMIKPFSARELLVRIGATLSLAKVRQEFTNRLVIENAKLSAVLDNIPVAVWVTEDPSTSYASSNRYAASLLTMPEDANVSLSAPQTDRVTHFAAFRHGEELPLSELPLQRAARGETVRGLDVELRFKDGRKVDLLTEARPLLNAAGEVVGGICVGVDITERKRAEEALRLLTNELNHRVKNTLAIMQSLASQTARYTTDPAAFQQVFSARMLALARAHDLLTRETWQGAKLADVADASLSPFTATATLKAAGPDILLSPNAAVALSMAFHELATNATKYGALSAQSGRVTLHWNYVDPERSAIQLVWTEEGGPLVQGPVRPGFGSRLIPSIAAQLDGEATVSYDPTGIICRFLLPREGVEAGKTILAPASPTSPQP
jgi:signal transduction histidine kinase/DNA-binding NarL/FixJ family response regulator